MSDYDYTVKKISSIDEVPVIVTLNDVNSVDVDVFLDPTDEECVLLLSGAPVVLRVAKAA